jgi:hypothetical protein
MRITHHSATLGELLIVGYNRKVLGQTGTGHFSPIGGYHRGTDMALIMDVARFKCESKHCAVFGGWCMILRPSMDA